MADPVLPSTDREQAPPSPPDRTPPDQEQSIVRAAAILAIGNVASRLFGLARQTVKANLFGASGLLSAFEVAAFVPISLYELIIGGMVNAALVPVFSDYATKERRDELWGVLSTVLSVATIVLLLVVGFVELFAPQIAWLVGANEFNESGLTDVAIRLMRMAAPTILFLGIASVLTGALFALKRFNVPAFIGAVFNGTIVIVALLRPDHIDSLVWGMLLGSLLQIVVQLWALRDARLRWRLDWRHPAVRRILQLYTPIVAGLVVNQLAIALSFNLATRTGDQSISYMKFATTLYQFPLGLVVTALSVATLPTLARQASGQLLAFKQTLTEGLRLVITLILPATAGLFALAVPIVALLFEHGEFTTQDTATTALVLRVYLFGLPFAAIDQMLVYSSFARKDTWRPALVGVISILIYSLTAVALLRPLGLLSLMVADAVKHVTHTIMMIWVVRGQIGSLRSYGIAKTTLKSIIAAIITGATAFIVARFAAANLPLTGFSQSLLVVLMGGAAGVLAYTLMVFALDISQAKSLPHMLLRR
ncbi:MAG: murein biosynthesis integral membrane protein MurJ [Chloroflexi bacterium]|jgi:putative peptidoglycan lipid II flippase|nr:murein biosynthesis integral membrane protein MurJ [Chloroflexota bacterium]